ncbi:uncharacterized protein N7483_004147 [Penicillium malachiteum]|uniref:uncharacterized protein n=1 Tax=Penicillium malachiteum TaxID=1324776 RepID=UPI002547CEFD|nr:uncharacterized protein N7483_004147 [Penicillium malachiteum]KAJ5729639.1 hypothetical protein N7483_004147 [Penicillium malachiteum]
MRLFPSPIFRHVARGMTGPAQRSFVTSTRRFQVQDANMSDLLAAAHRLEGAKKAHPTAEHMPLSEVDANTSSPGTTDLMNGARITMRDRHLWLSVPDMDMKELKLSYVYLRDLCKCPRCVDPNSKQRTFRSSDIPLNIQPQHVRWDNEYLEIEWNKDTEGTEGTHFSRWHYTYLVNPSINTHDSTLKSMPPLLWNLARMEKAQHWIDYEDYMTDRNQFIIAMRSLQRTGLIFVKGIPDSREMVEKIATRMGPLRNTFYGMTWDVRKVPQAKNVAYTNQFLGFHMDLMYMNEPPGYQLLHCLENSCQGGESLFADAFYAANQMKAQRREQYDFLTKVHLAYEYVHKDQIYYNTRPVFELDERTGELGHVNYSPPFQAAIPEPKRLDDIESKLDDLDSELFNPDSELLNPDPKLNYIDFVHLQQSLQIFTNHLESPGNVFELKLNPGECVIFDNRRIVHARRQFNTATGSRWLAGAYVDTDAVRSRFHICTKQEPQIWRHFNPDAYLVPFDLDNPRSSDRAIKAAYRMGHEMTNRGAGKYVKYEPEQIAGKRGKSRNTRRKIARKD